MKKCILICLLGLMMTAATACAAILPATGIDVDFYAWTGIKTTPAVQLCESLSVCDTREGKTVDTRRYTGETIPVIENWDGWAKIYYADGNKTGWVRSDYLVLDPEWYVCDGSTQVHAYPDDMSPCVALLGEGEKLAILNDTGDWVCVSLRAASGWIKKRPADTVSETWFRPQMLGDIAGATLNTDAFGTVYVDDADVLDELEMLLIHADDLGGLYAGCPFTAELNIELTDGKTISLALATDSCCVYRVDGRDYQYARHLKTGDNSVDNEALYGLFGISLWK